MYICLALEATYILILHWEKQHHVMQLPRRSFLQRALCDYRGTVMSDRAGNCDLSRFEAECLEVVVVTDVGIPVLETAEVMQSDLLTVAATHVGIGYIERDGKVWWTILAGTDGGAPAEPEEEVIPVDNTVAQTAPEPAPKESSPGTMSPLGYWLSAYHP